MSNLEEVARIAGVSASTVSRALSRPDMVAKATRERVLKAVTQANFHPNEMARSLRSQDTRSIGLVVTDLNPFHAALVKGVQDAAEGYDLNVILFTSDESERRERRALETLRSYQPQGVILTPSPHTAGHQHLLSGLPIVEVDRASGLPEVHTVQVDNVSSTRAAIKYLTDLGHRRIAGIFGPLEVSTSATRMQGYKLALQDAGIEYDESLVRYGDYREASGYRTALELLDVSAEARPTAIFASSLEMNVGAIRAIQQLGLTMPRDISLLGFDDARIMTVLQPTVTVMAQPSYQLGAEACHTLIRLLRQPQHEGVQNVRLPTELIVRQSTGPPSAGGASKGLRV